MDIKSSNNFIKQLQILKRKSKLKFNNDYNNYYNEMNELRQIGEFMFEENPFSENLEGIGIIMNEALLLLNFCQTKPELKKKNIKNYDLYYTLILNLLGGK